MLKINNFYIKKYINIKNKVKNIIKDIKNYGENALLFYIKNIDGIFLKNVKEIFLNNYNIKKCYFKISNYKKKIIKEIYIRLKRYHFHNLNNSWQINNKIDIIYGQKIVFIEKICVYVPGGNTIYPSSIYMNCIPSLIFKPKFTLMLTPIKNAKISNLLISVAYINNINNILLSGGVHSLSCVVFGTKNINKINKITGPANYYITLAKKELFGNVGIDMLAGPSELMIICDGKINPNIIALDFFSQLEHDVFSKCFLISNNKNYINLLYFIIYKLLKFQNNKLIIIKSLNNSFLLYKNFINSLELINFFSPEHLMLCLKKYNYFIDKIINCGTIFINYKTSESYGDYMIGPSHIIPTNKNSKFSSSLNINDFCKKINIIKTINNNYSKKITSYFSKIEKFFSHFYSSLIRI
ncbi:histidinol dehydrogenase [Candidatus Carsonella ruddii]|uniref:Histidinol dehydrogenase n=1 Tax=Candidatus Carsonella ruddii HC isolate Thao2000 TaxID=1202538 RepID=J3VPT1_CARRU|nr:histidinol dehydrogenase [Candidatus Carsonella ruddii]AFP83906.1 histidinol dehydrogenase [Candidatus Carsonella ruddii HC isolate Thao2000]